MLCSRVSISNSNALYSYMACTSTKLTTVTEVILRGVEALVVATDSPPPNNTPLWIFITGTVSDCEYIIFMIRSAPQFLPPPHLNYASGRRTDVASAAAAETRVTERRDTDPIHGTLPAKNRWGRLGTEDEFSEICSGFFVVTSWTSNYRHYGKLWVQGICFCFSLHYLLLIFTFNFPYLLT